MSSLRSELVKLAHEVPEMRGHILPLLRREGAGGLTVKVPLVLKFVQVAPQEYTAGNRQFDYAAISGSIMLGDKPLDRGFEVVVGLPPHGPLELAYWLRKPKSPVLVQFVSSTLLSDRAVWKAVYKAVT